MKEYKQPTTVTHMLSDPMWVLSENIVVDRIVKKVAEEPFAEAMLHSPIALASLAKRTKFYSINEMLNIPSLSIMERIAKSVAEEPLEAGANMEDVPNLGGTEPKLQTIPRRRSKKRTREWGTPLQRKL